MRVKLPVIHALATMQTSDQSEPSVLSPSTCRTIGWNGVPCRSHTQLFDCRNGRRIDTKENMLVSVDFRHCMLTLQRESPPVSPHRNSYGRSTQVYFTSGKSSFTTV